MASTMVKSWTHTTTGYPGTLNLTDTSVPSQPAPYHLLVKVHASSINPVDIQLMNVPLFNLPYLNCVKLLARDFSGTVIAASPESGFSKNEQICGILPDFFGTTGTLTEVSYFDIRKSCCVKKPVHLSHAQAASLPLVYLTARTSIERVTPFLQASKLADNKVVVLGGSSATGIYTVKLAKQRGWTVLSSCSNRNTDFVKALGADQLVDYTESPLAVVDAVRAFQPGAIIDCVGGTGTIGLAPQYVTIVGDKTSRSSMGGSALYLTHPTMVIRYLMGRLGLSNSYECIVLDGRKDWLEEINKLKAEEVVIDSTFEFSKVKEAFERLNSGRCRGKVVVEIEN